MRKWLLISLAAALAIGLGLLIWELDLPSWQRLDLDRIRATPESTTVYDASGNPAGALYAANRRSFVPLSEVPPQVAQAFIAAEDQRFYRNATRDF